MQIIALITGDDKSLRAHNYSIATDDLIELLSKFPHLIFEGGYGYYGLFGNFSQKWEMNVTKTLGPNGLCFTFNFPGSEKFFQEEM